MHDTIVWAYSYTKRWVFKISRHGNNCSAVAEMGDHLATIDMDRKLGAVPPSNNVDWAEAYVRIKWHLDPSSLLATIDMGRNVGLCPFLGGAGSPSNNVPWAEAKLRTKWHLGPSSRLVTTDMGPKLEGCAHLGYRELGLHLIQCGQGRGLPPCQVSPWSI